MLPLNGIEAISERWLGLPRVWVREEAYRRLEQEAEKKG